VFFTPVLHHFGWSRARLSSGYAASALSAGAIGLVVGWLLDRVDACKVMVAGVALIVAGYLLITQTHSFPEFFSCNLLLGVGFVACTGIPSSLVLANWFTARRGLAMGIATVFVIPSNIEPLFWLVIFIISAFVIARAAASRHFLHGLLLGIVNSIWITGAHILFVNQYLANHPKEAAMMQNMPRPDSPRLMMAMVGPIAGLVSGAVIGLLAFIAGKLLKRRLGAAA